MQKPVSVSQLNRYIKRILGTDPILSRVSVTGEVSGLTKHSGGQWYFSLKDEYSRLSCFLPEDRVRALRFDISEGMSVIAYGNISVYERGGYYSLCVNDVEAEGEGDLSIAFEALKRRLEKEGLFRKEHKRPLPAFPKLIGVATSPTGAAVRDIISTLKRRSPLTDIIIYPCLVQGESAAESVCRAVAGLNAMRPRPDLMIVGRGGGSAEDLWTFNEEKVARAVYASEIPVISAVGHEKDFVITDFTADLRAATPTAAAELAAPHADVLFDMLESASPARLFELMESRVDFAIEKLERQRLALVSAEDRIISDTQYKIGMLLKEAEAEIKRRLEDLEKTLGKGFALVSGLGGKRYSSYKDLTVGEEIRIQFKDGFADCEVKALEGKDDH